MFRFDNFFKVEFTLWNLSHRSNNQCGSTNETRATADANYQFNSDNNHDQVQSKSIKSWLNFSNEKLEWKKSKWLLFHFFYLFKSNVTGVHGDKRQITKSIGKVLNRLIEVTVPRIFKFNQDLFNYVVNHVIVPRINRILAIFAVKLPSISFGNKKNETVFLRQQDEKTIMKYLKENPISYSDDERVLNMLFDERFYAKNFIGSSDKNLAVKKTKTSTSLNTRMSNMSCFGWLYVGHISEHVFFIFYHLSPHNQPKWWKFNKILIL